MQVSKAIMSWLIPGSAKECQSFNSYILPFSLRPPPPLNRNLRCFGTLGERQKKGKKKSGEKGKGAKPWHSLWCNWFLIPCGVPFWASLRLWKGRLFYSLLPHGLCDTKCIIKCTAATRTWIVAYFYQMAQTLLKYLHFICWTRHDFFFLSIYSWNRAHEELLFVQWNVYHFIHLEFVIQCSVPRLQRTNQPLIPACKILRTKSMLKYEKTSVRFRVRFSFFFFFLSFFHLFFSPFHFIFFLALCLRCV